MKRPIGCVILALSLSLCIQGFQKDGDSLWVRIACPKDILKYIVPKGYIAIDGTSLTVVHVQRHSVQEEDEDLIEGPKPVMSKTQSITEDLQENAEEYGWFDVMLIKHTQSVVTLPRKKTMENEINLEVDVISKYVERSMEAHLESAPGAKHLRRRILYDTCAIGAIALVAVAAFRVIKTWDKK